MKSQEVEQQPDPWNEQAQRQRRAVRTRRVGAFAVVAGILAAVIVALVARGGERAKSVPSVITEPAGEELAIVDVGSGTETPFAAPDGASGFDVTLDGSMVAYTDLDGNGTLQVFVMDADGSNARQLTHAEGSGVYPGPIWSPDGSMIAYVQDTSHDTQMFVVRLSDGGSTMVTQEPQGAVDPGGWAPDGGSIVFSTLIFSPIHHYAAISVDIATGETRRIVADGSTPTLSPDGARIAFNSWLKEPVVRLILANSDGSERHVIARFDGDDGYQRWSPDSTQIAYIDEAPDGGFGTYVYDLATHETRFVTSGTLESWFDDSSILVSPL